MIAWLARAAPGRAGRTLLSRRLWLGVAARLRCRAVLRGSRAARPLEQCYARHFAKRSCDSPGAAAVASGPSRPRPPAHFTMTAALEDSCVCMQDGCARRALPTGV